MNDAEIRAKLKQYNFYHVIRLTDNIVTDGVRQYLRYQAPVHRALETLDLTGKRVLDIGCRDGLFALQAEKLGAREVIGIDNHLSPGATDFLVPFFGSKVQMYELNIVDLTPDHYGHFDVVICAGVLYHLRYPFMALRRLRDVMCEGGQLLLETAVLVDRNRHAMLHCPVGRESPYERSSPTFFNRKGLRDTLLSFGFVPEYETMFNSRFEPVRQLLKELLRGMLGRKPRRIVDRATLICRFQRSVIDEEFELYWDGLHRLSGWRK